MALSQPIVFAGVQDCTFVNKSTRIPYGKLRVIQSVSFTDETEKTELFGGSQKSAWSSVTGQSTRALEITSNEYPAWLLELAAGGTKSVRAAEPTGFVSAITSRNGLSLTSATDGVEVAKTASAEADLKTGTYTIVATAAKTADIYVSASNVTSENFTDDTLKIASIDLTTGTAILAGYGLTFTEATTADFTVGDTATFQVRSINTGSFDVSFGSEGSDFPEIEAWITGQLTSGKQVILRVLRCVAAGMPLTFTPNEFSEYTLSFSVLYDSCENKTHELYFQDAGNSGVC